MYAENPTHPAGMNAPGDFISQLTGDLAPGPGATGGRRTGVRMAAFFQPNYRVFELPWSPAPEERSRFRKIVLGICILLFLLSIVVPFLPAEQPDRNAAADIPPRLAKLLIEKKTPPPPPEVRPEPVNEIVEPEPVKSPEPEPLAVQPEPVLADTPEPPAPKTATEQARERASKMGLMAMADSLADLRQNNALERAPGDTLASAVGAGERNERSLITSNAGRASSGINTAALSRNTGGGSLAGRSTTQVSSAVGDGRAAAARRARNAATDGADGRGAQRSQEQIETVFDRNKAAIYALYRRALRGDPTLQGKLVLKLTIAPSGQVVKCEVLSSQLNDPEFEKKLVARVKLFDFGAQDVLEITTTKPIDFFPA